VHVIKPNRSNEEPNPGEPDGSATSDRPTDLAETPADMPEMPDQPAVPPAHSEHSATSDAASQDESPVELRRESGPAADAEPEQGSELAAETGTGAAMPGQGRPGEDEESEKEDGAAEPAPEQDEDDEEEDGAEGRQPRREPPAGRPAESDAQPATAPQPHTETPPVSAEETGAEPEAESSENAGPAAPPEPPPLQPTAGGAYRVALDAYNGPLDLLLYLIRKEEVDIYDIPVARIAQQYLGYIELLREINVNVAGEFLVMAATLMELKSRMLLPTEEIEDEEGEDPRTELVRQLLEYKRFKDAARQLGDRAADQARKFPRPGTATPDLDPDAEEQQADRFLEGVGLWELVDAFAKVVSETSLGGPTTQVLERERPLHEFRRDLLRILGDEGRFAFSQLFERYAARLEKIAVFIALLELVRLKRVVLQQPAAFGEIYLALSDGSPAPPVHGLPADDQAETERPQAAKWDAAAIAATNVIDEIEAEDDALGRARQRVDTAIEQAEAFLERHHAADEAPPDADEPEPAPTDTAPHEPARNDADAARDDGSAAAAADEEGPAEHAPEGQERTDAASESRQ
jgi:segregation and condensation protein A